MARPHPSAHALILCALIALAPPPAHARAAGGNAAGSLTATLQVLTASWWPSQIDDATFAKATTYVSKVVRHGLPARGSAGKLAHHREDRGGGGRRNRVPVFGIGCVGNSSDPNGPCG
jgi:hypothetical protein